MFFNNLGECENKFYLGKCNKCNYCKLNNKQDYLIYTIDKQESLISDLLNYMDIKELKEEVITLFFMKQHLKIIKQELNKF